MKKLLLLLSLTSISTQSLAFIGPAVKGITNWLERIIPPKVQEFYEPFLVAFTYTFVFFGLLGFLYMAYLNLLGLLGKEEKNPFKITNFLFTKGQKNSPRISNFLRFFVFLALGLFCGYFLYWRFS